MEFSFDNLTASYGDRDVLCGVSGSVNCGEVLGIIGHEVSGKTSLLSTLAGRLAYSAGSIQLNGAVVRQTALPEYVAMVTEEDLFLPALTINETFEYAAKLRLPESMSANEKETLVKDTRSLLELDDVGRMAVQFTSRHHKKRLAIACEMVRQCSVVLIDNPFNGFTYKETLGLMKTLVKMAAKLQRAVVVTCSLPIDVVINQCHHVMFLYKGSTAYSGKAADLRNFLRSAGTCCRPDNSPSEFLMHILCEGDESFLYSPQTLVDSSDRQRHCHTVKDNISQNDVECVPTNDDVNHTCSMFKETAILSDDLEVGQLLTPEACAIRKQKFHTSFWRQLLILTSRNFHNARRRILFPVSIIQNLYILVICVLIWWRPDRTEATVKDRIGLFFFTTVQWAFFALLDAILTFPKEQKLVIKELNSNLYRPSTFCLSKTLSELPLSIIQPCVYLAVIYWVANLNGAAAFLASLGVLFADVIAAQSIGLFVGAALNPPWTVSVVSLGLLSMMLWGGAFNTPPTWLRWGKMASYFTYGLNAFISLEFQEAAPIKCAVNSMVPMCSQLDPATNLTNTHFPSAAVLLLAGITWLVWQNVLVLLLITVVMRCLWYMVIRLKT